MMQKFSGWEYLLIDVANNFGLDKKTFQERIAWATENLNDLEVIGEAKPRWKTYPLYVKAVMAVRRAQRGDAIGHMVGMDAIASGMQIMSVLTGCLDGARHTGLIDTGERPDPYTDMTEVMQQKLGTKVEDDREKVKVGVMTSLYGSEKEPELLFGKGTKELEAFEKSMFEICPGACDALQLLVDSWNSFALSHSWTLPDGFDVNVKVMKKVQKGLEIDELGGHTMQYVWYENEGCETDVKNAANVIHSVDAYIKRCLERRCNYNEEYIAAAHDAIVTELLSRHTYEQVAEIPIFSDERVERYVELYEKSGMADIVIIDYLTSTDLKLLSTEHLNALNRILHQMLLHRPFEIITVHDDFKAHPNNLNHLRGHYRDILAEMADSNLFNWLLSQVYGFEGTYQKRSTNLSSYIRKSNYALT